MKNITKSLTVLIIILVLCTCKKEPEIPSVNDVEISKTAVVANSTTINNLLSYDSLSLTFSSSASQISQLTAGSILVIEKGEGLLRKVKSVQNVGGNLKVTTENARLEEVIIHGVIESEVTLDPETVISYKFSDDRLSLGKGGKFSFVFNKYVVGVSQGSSIIIDGGTQFDPPKIKIKAYFNNGLDSLNASLEINSTTTYKLTADGGISGEYKTYPPLAEYTFSPISIFIGPVPVLITPKVLINVGANASISGKMEAGFEASTKIVGGIKYKNKAVSTYSSISQTLTNPIISLAAKGSIEGYLMVPKLGFYFYSIAGPFIDLKLYGTLKDITTTTSGLYFGVKGEGGFETDILSLFKFPNLQWKKDFPIYEKEIFTLTSSVKPTVTTSQPSSITSTSVIVGGNVSADGGSAVTDRGVYWGTSQDPETTGTKLQIGSGLGNFSTTITGLIANTTYYLKAYGVNGQGPDYGNQINFTTNPITSVPTANTTAPSSILQTSAVLNGTVNANNLSTAVSFEYGSTNAYGQTINATPNTVTGNINTPVTATITGLTAGTTYHYRVKVINSAGTTLGDDVVFITSGSGSNGIVFNPNLTYGSVSDIDGNSYKTIQIGTQTWMAENLKTTKYDDGTSIPYETNNTNWLNLSTPAYCWYNNDEATYKADYGALYNWFTVNTGKLCPTGWHIPSDTEWKTMEMLLGMSQAQADIVGHSRGTNEGGKLKETGLNHWFSPNTGASNSSGFSGLGGGYRYGLSSGTFYQIKHYGGWWTSSSSSSGAYERIIFSEESIIERYDASPKTYGFSVRCMKDNASGVIPTNGLVAYYPFNGNANDESGYGNNGTNNGAALVSDRFGNTGKAMSFNGTSNFIQIPTSTSFQGITNEITVSSWIKKGVNNLQDQFIVSRRDQTNPGIHFLTEINPSLGFMFLTGGVGTPTPGYTYLKTQNSSYSMLNDGNWHNVTVTHKYGIGTSSAIYIDGVLVSSSWVFTGPNYPVNIKNVDVFIGKQDIAPPSSGFANGYIDDIRIYNRVLSVQEIAALFNE